jgi:hypothetical protein
LKTQSRLRDRMSGRQLPFAGVYDAKSHFHAATPRALGAEYCLFYSGNRFPFRCRQPGAISHEWGLSDAQSARLLSIFGLTFALGAPLAQVMFGTMMRRTQVLAGMLVFALGALFLPRAELRIAGHFAYCDGAGRVADRPGAGGVGAELVSPKSVAAPLP